jgi:Ca-activated chloride channel homolog
MTEDDLKRLKELPVPAPREGAKEAAITAALVAFKAGASSDAGAPQGSAVLPRLRDTSSVSEGSSKMRYRRPAAIAASIAVLAVAVPLFMTHLVRTHTGPDRVAPHDKLAALPDPGRARAPSPPADVARTGGATSTPPAPSVGAAPEEESRACPPGTQCLMLLPEQIEQLKQKAVEVLAKRKAPVAAEDAPTARGGSTQPATSYRTDVLNHYFGDTGRYSIDFADIDDGLNPNAGVDSSLSNWRGSLQRKAPPPALPPTRAALPPYLRLTDRWSVLGQQERYDVDDKQAVQDVFQIEYQDECFVLSTSYIETFVEDAALDLQEDRTAILRYELRSPCQYGYRTDALSRLFHDIHKENAPASADHVATSGSSPAEKSETHLMVAADWKRKMVEPVDQVWTPFADVHVHLYSFSDAASAPPAPPTTSARDYADVVKNAAPGRSAFPKSKGGIFGTKPKIDRALPVYLQTDRLVYDEMSNRVIAEGNVEVSYNNHIVTADKVIYDQRLNKLTFEGNARLKDPNGSITRADRFEATDDFRDAFIQSLSVVATDDTSIVANIAVRKQGNVPSTFTQEARRAAVLAQTKWPAPITTQPFDPHRKADPVPQVEAQGSATAVAALTPRQTLASKAPATSPSRPATAGAAPQERVQGCPPGRTCTLLYPKQVKEKASAMVAALEAGERSRLPSEAPPPTQEGRDRFAAAAANPVKSVASEPVSTFSIDVDSASYAFVRRALNSAQLPPKEAVRVEEMINYFPYDYPLPEDRSAPFRPTVSVLPSPWNPANKLVHIAIKGYDVPKTERPRANLVLLIDTSGSMAPEDRLPLIKNAFRMLIDTLRPDDTVGIVTYAGQTHAALEPTKVSDKRKILEAVERLTAGGSTAGGAGMQEAYRMAEGAFDKAAVNRVILATDGDFNVGTTSVDELKSLVERKRETGIYLSVLGVGRGNYNDALMQALAQNGNGVAAYIDTLNEARKVLVDEVSSSLFPIAKDVKIQIEFNPAMAAEYRLIGYETRLLRREDFNNDKIDAGDIGSGHMVTAIYEVTPVGSPTFVEDLRYRQPVAATPKADKGEYGFLRINYKLPAETMSRRIELAITHALEKAAIDQAPTDVRFAVAVAAFGQLLRGDPYLKGFGYDEVIALAASARGEDLFGYRAEFLNLVRLAKTARP